MNPSKAYFRAQENNDSGNFGAGSADQGESGMKFPARVNKYQKVTQEGRDEGRAPLVWLSLRFSGLYQIYLKGWSRKVLFKYMENKRIL